MYLFLVLYVILIASDHLFIVFFFLQYNYIHIQRHLAPVIEDNTKSAFLTEHPVDIIKAGRYNKVPLIIGFDTHEGIISDILYPDTRFKFHEFNNFCECIPYYLNIPSGDKILKIMEDKIKQYYYTKPTNDEVENTKYFYTVSQ